MRDHLKKTKRDIPLSKDKKVNYLTFIAKRQKMLFRFLITFELFYPNELSNLMDEVQFSAFYKGNISLRRNPAGTIALPANTVLREINNEVSASDVCINFVDMLENHMSKIYLVRKVCVVSNKGECAAMEKGRNGINVLAFPENSLCNF